jgi:1-acyl-sn-glycerol-3-phosphate acyltransferase
MRLISLFILKIFGWEVKGKLPKEIKKCVLIEAPHTSNIDFVIGRLAFFYLGIKAKFLIKKELFFFPMGFILKNLGGIPIDRKKSNNVVDYVSSLIRKSDELVVVITPEGTRKYNPNWKKGFYYIAIKSEVPIVLAYIDYSKKEGGIGKVIYPDGNFEKDFAEITEFYKDKTAKYPEKFNLSPMYRK